MTPKEIAQKHRALEKLFEQKTKELAPYGQDPAVLKLPHPIRILATADMQPEILGAGIVGVEYEAYLIEQLKAQRTTNNLWLDLEARNSHTFLKFIQLNSSGIDGGLSGGASGATFQAMRYQHAGGHLFTIDDSLMEMMMLTDIDLDVPMSAVQLPFDNVYIEFGKDRNALPVEYGLRNSVSGFHAFEGAYISRTVDDQGLVHLEVTMTGSPMGHSHISDDAVEWISMTQTEGVTVHEALYNAFTKGVPMLGAGPEVMQDFQRRAAAHRDVIAPMMAKRLELIIKALLFINLKEIRRQLLTDRTEARKALMRSQSGAHRRKALQRMLRSQDTILVLTPPPSERSPSNGDGTGNHLEPHPRRGHLRLQRHGVKLTLTKIVLIAPVRVNAAYEVAAAPAPPKTYIVR